jgi:hypothetical protein
MLKRDTISVSGKANLTLAPNGSNLNKQVHVLMNDHQHHTYPIDNFACKSTQICKTKETNCVVKQKW